jgi:peptide chain release factor
MKKFIQITSGRGPEECCFAVAQVLKKIIKECKASNCYHEVIHREPSNINGNLYSAALWVDTKNNPQIIDGWIGTIQWVSQSPFRLHHKRKNWFVGVFEIDQALIGTFDFAEVTYDTFRSSGPGGQNVNKVSSAVRALHKPTGLFVKVMDTRSQLQNKKLANERLLKLWNEFQLDKIKQSNENSWSNHLNLQRGNPVKVFRSKDFKLKSQPKKYKNQRSKEKQKWKRELE